MENGGAVPGLASAQPRRLSQPVRALASTLSEAHGRGQQGENIRVSVQSNLCVWSVKGWRSIRPLFNWPDFGGACYLFAEQNSRNRKWINVLASG